MEQNTSFQLAEIQLSYTPNYNITERPKLTTSQQTYRLLKDHWDLGRLQLVEEFKIILLNRRNRRLGIIDLAIGGFAGVVVDTKVIFAAGLTACASGIILVHNHPSGETEPSHADIQLTRRLVEAGKLLDLRILEHLIISKDGYFSFADEGLL